MLKLNFDLLTLLAMGIHLHFHPNEVFINFITLLVNLILKIMKLYNTPLNM